MNFFLRNRLCCCWNHWKRFHWGGRNFFSPTCYVQMESSVITPEPSHSHQIELRIDMDEEPPLSEPETSCAINVIKAHVKDSKTNHTRARIFLLGVTLVNNQGQTSENWAYKFSISAHFFYSRLAILQKRVGRSASKGKAKEFHVSQKNFSRQNTEK